MVFYVTFGSFFNHIVTVFACDRYYGCYHVALPHWDTVPQTTRKQLPQPVTFSLHQANQSLFYPLNAGRQAKKHLVQVDRLWFDDTRDRYTRPPAYEADTAYH